MKYVLAIDQGTHASRALVFSANGRILVRSSSHDIALSRPRSGYVEQDAEEIIQSVHDAVDEALQRLSTQERRRLCACGITTQRSTVVAWNRDGRALSPAINWQDTRSALLTQQLLPEADNIRRLSGLPLSPHYGAGKLHWLFGHTENAADLYAGPLASFLLYRLTGNRCYCADHSNAQRMQLFDLHTLDWSPQLADWFKVPLERLPVCRPVLSAYGTLAGYTIPVTAVCGDQNAAWSGAGKPPADSIMINLGSGAFILAEQPEHTDERKLLTSIAWNDARQCRFLLEGTVNGAGNALGWFRDHYRIGDLEQKLPLWLQEATTPPLFLNTVGGLGSPWWQRGPQPAFIDDHGQYSPAERAAAIVESIVFLVQHNLEYIRDCRPVRRLRLSGGLSRLDALCQKLADLSGTPVTRSEDVEASARGIAWLAAGRPPEWHNDSPAADFQPGPNQALRKRYRAFTSRLQQELGIQHE